MPLTQDELIGFKQKRRDTFLRVVAVFASLTAAAIMVFFVLRLVNRRMTNDRKARVSVEGERQHFEANISSSRPQRDDPSVSPKGPREIIPNSDVVDMSARSPTPRVDRASLEQGTGASSRSGAAASAPASGTPNQKIIEHLDQKQAAIAEVLREFFEARTVVQMLPLVRDSRRVRPLMEEFYQRSAVKGRTWKGVGWSIPVEEPGYRFAYVQAIFGDSTPVNVVVEETDSGFLVDWESSVQYSEIGWKEFMATRPGQPKIFRVIASKAEGGTGSETMLTLKHPHEDGVVIGRFDLKDPRFRSLVEQLDVCTWKDVPVILRLCYPGPASEPNEVQIAGVEGKGWLILGDRARGS